jgi:hypothetical protein
MSPRLYETDTSGRVFYPAPSNGTPQHTGSIQGVWLNPGEEVEWCWVHTPTGGSYINGYTIKPKSFNVKEQEKHE